MEFQTESGHSETIFDINYHPTETNLLGSCSYDGSVRVWDVSLNKLVSINDTTKQPPQSKFEKKIIYSCSWHPKLTKIAMCTVNGYLLVYDALKGKLLSSLAPKEGHPSYKVDWNKIEPKNILMTSVANAIFVIGVMDQPKCSQLTVQRWYTSPAPVFGCAWSPRDSTIFMTGNKDGRVRIYDYSNIADGPIRTFEGHTKRVYNVIFNANLPNLIASGSDDRTIRIWDLNQTTSTSI